MVPAFVCLFVGYSHLGRRMREKQILRDKCVSIHETRFIFIQYAKWEGGGRDAVVPTAALDGPALRRYMFREHFQVLWKTNSLMDGIEAESICINSEKSPEMILPVNQWVKCARRERKMEKGNHHRICQSAYKQKESRP